MYRFYRPDLRHERAGTHPTVAHMVELYGHRRLNSKGELELINPADHAAQVPRVCHYTWEGPLTGEGDDDASTGTEPAIGG